MEEVGVKALVRHVEVVEEFDLVHFPHEVRRADAEVHASSTEEDTACSAHRPVRLALDTWDTKNG